MAERYIPYPIDEKGIEIILARAIEDTQEDLAMGKKDVLISYQSSPMDLDESKNNPPDKNDPGSDQSPPRLR